MRTVKVLAGVAGGILLLIVAVLLAVWVLVKPNDYKDRIAAAVKQSTGRDLVLTGDIHLSVFPWVALELGPATLGNPPGFGAEPFLAFNHAAVRINPWRLLSQQIDIQRVEIDGLDVRLRKDAQGVGNWENFGQARQPGAGAEAGGSIPALAGVRITHGRVSYPGVLVENLDFESGAFSPHGVTPVRIGFDASRGVPGERVTVSAQFSLGADEHFAQLRFEGVTLSGLLARPGDGRPAHWEMSAPAIALNLTAQTLSVPAYDLNYSSAHITGKLQATKILENLSATGSVALAPLSLREFEPRLGFLLPKTRDPRALAQFSGSGDFSYGASGVSFEAMQVQLDETHLSGSAALTREPRRLTFSLAADQVNLDRYLTVDHGVDVPVAGRQGDQAKMERPVSMGEPEQTGEAVKMEEVAKAGEAAKMDDVAKTDDPLGRGGAARLPEAPKVPDAPRVADTPKVPGAPRLPDAEGRFTVGTVHLSPLDFTQVRLTLASKDNVVHLFPAVAQLDGGSYSGNITVDDRGTAPTLSMDEHLSGVDMTRLLAATPYKGRLSGRGNVNIKATGRGAALDAVMRTLNGQFDATLSDGALEGIDLGYELAAAQALVKREALPPRSGPARTKFEAFKMSAQISNGVAQTSDLIIASPVLRVTGQGSANLVTKAIDFQMLAGVRAPGTLVADIPLKVTGTYANPTVRPDVETVAKGQLKQKLQDVLRKNGLQRLFGK